MRTGQGRPQTRNLIWGAVILAVGLLLGFAGGRQLFAQPSAPQEAVSVVEEGESAAFEPKTPQDSCVSMVTYFLTKELGEGSANDEVMFTHGRASAEYSAFHELLPGLRTPARERGVELAVRDIQPDLQDACAGAKTVNEAAPTPRDRDKPLTECEQVALIAYEEHFLGDSDRITVELLRSFGDQSPEYKAFRVALSDNTARRAAAEWGTASARALVENDVAVACGVGPLAGPDPVFAEEYPGQDMTAEDLFEEMEREWGGAGVEEQGDTADDLLQHLAERWESLDSWQREGNCEGYTADREGFVQGARRQISEWQWPRVPDDLADEDMMVFFDQECGL